MKRSWWLYAALLALALGAGLSAPQTAPESPVPSIDNPGPRGLKLLRLWLAKTGRDVRAVRGELPKDLRTLVLAAPVGHAVSKEELADLEAFVKSGGTLVYLRPRRSHAQPELDTWLELSTTAGPTPDPTRPEDWLGISEPVTVRGGALKGVARLRLVADDALQVGHDAAGPLTPTRMLWWLPLEQGEIYVGAGPDLAEAARLELDDNAAFWAALPSPIGFDELHQAPKLKPDLSANLIAALAQLGFSGLAFLLVFAPRLGPPRPTEELTHRSSLEYVESMGALAASARVEPELARELVDRLARVLDVPADTLPLEPQTVRTPQEFLLLSQRCAALERDTTGGQTWPTRRSKSST